MDTQQVFTFGQQSLYMLLVVSAPILLTVLAVGLVVSIFQAATQIHEATLSFVPKIIAAVAVLAVCGPWMLTTLVEFVQRTLQSLYRRRAPPPKCLLFGGRKSFYRHDTTGRGGVRRRLIRLPVAPRHAGEALEVKRCAFAFGDLPWMRGARGRAAFPRHRQPDCRPPQRQPCGH